MAAKLTTKELTSLSEQLGLEKMLVMKYNAMADACGDATIKNKCKQIARKHQKHYDKLFNYLG